MRAFGPAGCHGHYMSCGHFAGFINLSEGAIMGLAVLSVCVFTGALLSKHVIAAKRRVWG